VPEAEKDVRRGEWRQIVGRQLTGRTVGVIGCGHVGKDVCLLMRVFGCRLLAHDIREYPDFYARAGVQPVSLPTLLEQADIVTLHLPLDRTTRNILDAGAIARMRRGAVLINTARGGLVDEDAVADALRARRLSGAAFDVLEVEPPQRCRFIEMENVIVSPHIGGSTDEAILAMGRAAIDGLESTARPSAVVPDFVPENA
jgi:D-3-phosphoglycerate dehydrogenase